MDPPIIRLVLLLVQLPLIIGHIHRPRFRLLGLIGQKVLPRRDPKGDRASSLQIRWDLRERSEMDLCRARLMGRD